MLRTVEVLLLIDILDLKQMTTSDREKSTHPIALRVVLHA